MYVAMALKYIEYETMVLLPLAFLAMLGIFLQACTRLTRHAQTEKEKEQTGKRTTVLVVGDGLGPALVSLCLRTRPDEYDVTHVVVTDDATSQDTPCTWKTNGATLRLDAWTVQGADILREASGKAVWETGPILPPQSYIRISPTEETTADIIQKSRHAKIFCSHLCSHIQSKDVDPQVLSEMYAKALEGAGEEDAARLDLVLSAPRYASSRLRPGEQGPEDMKRRSLMFPPEFRTPHKWLRVGTAINAAIKRRPPPKHVCRVFANEDFETTIVWWGGETERTHKMYDVIAAGSLWDFVRPSDAEWHTVLHARGYVTRKPSATWLGASPTAVVHVDDGVGNHRFESTGHGSFIRQRIQDAVQKECCDNMSMKGIGYSVIPAEYPGGSDPLVTESSVRLCGADGARDFPTLDTYAAEVEGAARFLKHIGYSI
jgi:hypothetical protein